MGHDLILRGGRVIDPSQKLDAVTDVAFAGGKVARIGPQLEGDAGTDIRDVSGLIVTPGLIDLHTHVYWGGTSLGIDAEEFCRTSGVTTAIDTGSAGPGNFAGFRKHVIEPRQVRILAYLHVSHAGIYAFSNRVMVGESEELRLMDPISAVEVADANRDVIVGIKVRVGRGASGNSGTVPLDIALQVAERSRHAADVPHRPSAAELRGGARAAAAGRRAHPRLPAVPQFAGHPAGHGQAGGAGGAQARRQVRHRPRQGLVRLQDGARHAGQRLLSRHHLLRRARAVHRTARPSTR